MDGNAETRGESEVPDAATLSRRLMLRRAAAVGVAAAWATPIVQTIGTIPAFATGTPSPPPPPPPPPPPGSFTGISYIGLVFACNGKEYRAKWEEDDLWEDIGGEVLPQCPVPAGWADAEVYPNPENISVVTTYIGGELYSVTFTLPDTCTAADGSGVAKGGQPDNPNTGGYCVPGVVSDDAKSITFTA